MAHRHLQESYHREGRQESGKSGSNSVFEVQFNSISIYLCILQHVPSKVGFFLQKITILVKETQPYQDSGLDKQKHKTYINRPLILRHAPALAHHHVHTFSVTRFTAAMAICALLFNDLF